jgi:hypothetical protein
MDAGVSSYRYHHFRSRGYLIAFLATAERWWSLWTQLGIPNSEPVCIKKTNQ